MDIMYSTSDSYAFLTGISILSLFDNNKDADEINIYIMDNKITKENKNKLRSIAEKYHRNIFFVPMPDMHELTGHNIQTGRWNISTFGRLYMAGSLPEKVHKVLNIDCDTIIVDSIEPLWNTSLEGKVFGRAEFRRLLYERRIGFYEP